jgi:Ala-tRNA(Pro) deacylase
MSMPRWIPETLQQEHVPYQIRHHRPCYTAQEVAAAEHVSGHRLAKVVVVKADDELVVVVLPASGKLDLDAVRQTLHCSQCRIASEREIAERFSDCEVGAIPPLPHWDGIRMLADMRIMQLQGPMVFQAGTHEDAIEMSYDDWKRITHPSSGRLAMSEN